MNKLRTAMYIATGATILSVVGYLIRMASPEVGLAISNIGMLVGIVSYFYGGFKQACQAALKIAKFGWYIVAFPMDIVTFFLSFFLGIVIFLYLPIIPVYKAYKESQQE